MTGTNRNGEGAASGTFARHYLIRGRVQGVWYRMSAREEAHRLGLSGWIRNITGGEVEAVASGGAQQLDALEKWFWRGPRGAKVSAVEVEAIDYSGEGGFNVIR